MLGSRTVDRSNIRHISLKYPAKLSSPDIPSSTLYRSQNEISTRFKKVALENISRDDRVVRDTRWDTAKSSYAEAIDQWTINFLAINVYIQNQSFLIENIPESIIARVIFQSIHCRQFLIKCVQYNWESSKFFFGEKNRFPRFTRHRRFVIFGHVAR